MRRDHQDPMVVSLRRDQPALAALRVFGNKPGVPMGHRVFGNKCLESRARTKGRGCSPLLLSSEMNPKGYLALTNRQRQFSACPHRVSGTKCAMKAPGRARGPRPRVSGNKPIQGPGGWGFCSIRPLNGGRCLIVFLGTNGPSRAVVFPGTTPPKPRWAWNPVSPRAPGPSSGPCGVVFLGTDAGRGPLPFLYRAFGNKWLRGGLGTPKLSCLWEQVWIQASCLWEQTTSNPGPDTIHGGLRECGDRCGLLHRVSRNNQACLGQAVGFQGCHRVCGNPEELTVNVGTHLSCFQEQSIVYLGTRMPRKRNAHAALRGPSSSLFQLVLFN